MTGAIDTDTIEGLAALVDLCRSKGVAQLIIDDVTIVLGPLPVDLSALDGAPANVADNGRRQLTAEERWDALGAGSGLRPTINYADRFKDPDDVE